MDGLTNNVNSANTLNDPFHSGAKTIQFGKYTFLNMTDQLKTGGSVETGTAGRTDQIEIDAGTVAAMERTGPKCTYKIEMTSDVSDTKTFFKQHCYSDLALKSAPKAVRETKLVINAEMSSAVSEYYDGNLTEDELAQTFQNLSEKLLGTYEDLGYPNGLFITNQAGRESAVESFYDEFRFKLLSVAVQRNNQEGKQYVTGEMNQQREYKYYNADYYYKSEAAIAALNKGAEVAAEKLELTNFTIPDYKAEGHNCYYNFNSALSNNFCASEQYFLDYDQVPPEGFKWFYQSGSSGEVQKGVEAKCSAIYSPDGKLIWSREPEKSKPFDPTDPLSATTWVSYRDANGKEQRISKDVSYTHTKADLFNLSSLLKFAGGDPKLDAAANRFLRNIQICCKGYFLGQTTIIFA